MRFAALLVLAFTSGCFVMADPFATHGRVVKSSGVAGIQEGMACSVDILPEGKSWYPCRVTVTCGTETLYGGPRLGGYTYCEADNRIIQHAWDDKYAWHDGDPWLDLDMASGRVIIRNQRPDNEVVVEFTAVIAGS